MGLLGSLFGRKSVHLTADTIDKTRKFLAPQISAIEDTYGNIKYAVITFESIAYSVAIAEVFGQCKLTGKELMPFLLEVFGRDYETRFTHLFEILVNDYGPGALEPDISIRMKDLATNDVRSGINNNSNFLVSNANEINADLQRLKNIQM